jgi:hypothetical protein
VIIDWTAHCLTAVREQKHRNPREKLTPHRININLIILRYFWTKLSSKSQRNARTTQTALTIIEHHHVENNDVQQVTITKKRSIKCPLDGAGRAG